MKFSTLLASTFVIVASVAAIPMPDVDAEDVKFPDLPDKSSPWIVNTRVDFQIEVEDKGDAKEFLGDDVEVILERSSLGPNEKVTMTGVEVVQDATNPKILTVSAIVPDIKEDSGKFKITITRPSKFVGTEEIAESSSFWKFVNPWIKSHVTVSKGSQFDGLTSVGNEDAVNKEPSTLF